MIATVVVGTPLLARIAFGHERQTSTTTFSSLTETCPPSVGCGGHPKPILMFECLSLAKCCCEVPQKQAFGCLQ